MGRVFKSSVCVGCGLLGPLRLTPSARLALLGSFRALPLQVNYQEDWACYLINGCSLVGARYDFGLAYDGTWFW